MEISNVKHKRPWKSLRSNLNLIKNDDGKFQRQNFASVHTRNGLRNFQRHFSANVECPMAHFTRSAIPILTLFLGTPEISFILYLILNFQQNSRLLKMILQFSVSNCQKLLTRACVVYNN